MIIKRKISKYINLQKLPNKQLSIQFSLDGFSFCVFDLDVQEFVTYCFCKFDERNSKPSGIVEKLKQVFKEEPILQETFQKVVVLHDNNLSAFVPNVLFDKNQIGEYLKFNNKTFDSDFFAYDTLINYDMVLAYIPYINVNNFLIDQFGTFDYQHASSVLVKELLDSYAVKSGNSLFVNLSNTHFEIIVSEDKALHFYNSFDYKTKEDFIYYILFTLEQLKMNVEDIELQLLGRISKTDTLYQIAYKYIRNISFLADKSKFTSISGIDETLQREDFTLFKTI